MNSRRTTRLRSNRSTILSPKLFQASEKDIDRLQEVLGVKLPNHARDRIKHILERHFGLSYSAQNAPFASEVQQELRNIQEAARHLRSRISDNSNITKYEAIERLEEELAQTIPDAGANAKNLAFLLDCISSCCTKQVEDSILRATKWDGHYEWDRTVVTLTELFSELGLPTTANADPKPSTFVLFVAEMQLILPDVATKRSQHSHVAIAQSIKRAREAEQNRRLEITLSERSVEPGDSPAIQFAVQKDQEPT